MISSIKCQQAVCQLQRVVKEQKAAGIKRCHFLLFFLLIIYQNITLHVLKIIYAIQHNDVIYIYTLKLRLFKDTGSKGMKAAGTGK